MPVRHLLSMETKMARKPRITTTFVASANILFSLIDKKIGITTASLGLALEITLHPACVESVLIFAKNRNSSVIKPKYKYTKNIFIPGWNCSLSPNRIRQFLVSSQDRSNKSTLLAGSLIQNDSKNHTLTKTAATNTIARYSATSFNRVNEALADRPPILLGLI